MIQMAVEKKFKKMGDVIELGQRFFHGFVKAGGEHVTVSFYKMKKKLFYFGIEFVVFVLGMVCILISILLLLGRFFPIEWVLLVIGLLLLNVVMLTAKFR